VIRAIREICEICGLKMENDFEHGGPHYMDTGYERKRRELPSSG
jgi:hypothetical protein